MSISNQFTMVQLTIDNATMQIQSPKSHITNLRARPRVPFVPFVPDVRDVSNVSVVSDVRGFSDVHGVSANARCPKRNRTPRNAEFRSQCRVGGPRVSKGLSSNAEFSQPGIQNSIPFHVFQLFHAFHFFHSFQPFQKRPVKAKNETDCEVNGGVYGESG